MLTTVIPTLIYPFVNYPFVLTCCSRFTLCHDLKLIATMSNYLILTLVHSSILSVSICFHEITLSYLPPPPSIHHHNIPTILSIKRGSDRMFCSVKRRFGRWYRANKNLDRRGTFCNRTNRDTRIHCLF